MKITAATLPEAQVAGEDRIKSCRPAHRVGVTRRMARSKSTVVTELAFSSGYETAEIAESRHLSYRQRRLYGQEAPAMRCPDSSGHLSKPVKETVAIPELRAFAMHMRHLQAVSGKSLSSHVAEFLYSEHV